MFLVTSFSFETEGASKTEVVGEIVLVRFASNRCISVKLIIKDLNSCSRLEYYANQV